MSDLCLTLLTDGSSDDALLFVIEWLLREHGVTCPIQSSWAELRRLPNPPARLSGRMQASVELYPCDVLFVHRDAEKEPRIKRVEEIMSAREALPQLSQLPLVCVVPVRMQEAWFLFDEAAIRRAAGNPNGRDPVPLPDLTRLEDLPDPKAELHNLLRIASGLSGRRRRRVPTSRYARRIADFTESYSPLRSLPAFAALEQEVETAVLKNGWNKR